MKILLLEDEKDLAQTGKEQLELMGHEVFTAFDIAEARRLLVDDETHFNVVIADHRLPDGLGIDFVIELREQFTNTKFVIVSGVLTDKDVARLEIYEVPFFHKPLLYRTIMESLTKEFMSSRPVVAPSSVDEVPESGQPAIPPAAAESGAGGESRIPFWKRIFGGKD